MRVRTMTCGSRPVATVGNRVHCRHIRAAGHSRRDRIEPSVLHARDHTVMRVAFWGLVALDLLGILLLFVLGLAAAGSSRTSPVQVALVLLVLPSIPLVASVVLFVRATSP